MGTVAQAKAHQADGISYNADNWVIGQLEAGTRLYKMMPASGPYYFNYEAYREFASDPSSMYGGLQVRVSKRYAMRVVVVEFEVQSSLSCPVCVCAANADFGGGGATQYFIDEAQRASHLFQSSPGWGLDGNGIGYF